MREARKVTFESLSAGPKRGCLNVGAWNPQESGRKAPLSCNAAFSMLQCSFSFVAAQLLVRMTSALQKSRCCSAVSAAQHSENCSATSVFACVGFRGVGFRMEFPNPERSQNRRFPEKSRIELRTGEFRPSQNHNLLLAKLILSHPVRNYIKRGWELAWWATKCGSDLAWIYLSATQFETFQEIGDFD